MLRCKNHFKQPQDAGSLVVTSISTDHFKQLQDNVDATLQHPFQSTSQTLWVLRCNIQFEVRPKTLWMLRCNILFNQLPRRSGCYVLTSISSSSKTLWMLRCNIHFNQLPGRSGCYVVTSNLKSVPRRSGCYVITTISINFPDALDATL